MTVSISLLFWPPNFWLLALYFVKHSFSPACTYQCLFCMYLYVYFCLSFSSTCTSIFASVPFLLVCLFLPPLFFYLYIYFCLRFSFTCRSISASTCL